MTTQQTNRVDESANDIMNQIFVLEKLPQKAETVLRRACEPRVHLCQKGGRYVQHHALLSPHILIATQNTICIHHSRFPIKLVTDLGAIFLSISLSSRRSAACSSSVGSGLGTNKTPPGHPIRTAYTWRHPGTDAARKYDLCIVTTAVWPPWTLNEIIEMQRTMSTSRPIVAVENMRVCCSRK